MSDSIDSYSPPAIVREYNKPLPSADEIIQWVNNTQMDGKKLALPESREFVKKQVEETVWKRFLNKGLDKRYNGIEAHFMEEGVWAISEKGSKNTQIYVDNNGQTLFSISGIAGRAPIKAVLGDLGLRDIKWEDKVWRIYKKEADGKERVIEQSSPEYFHIWQDEIIFRADIYDSIIILDPRIKYKESYEWLNFFAESNVLNLRVLKAMRDAGVLNKPKMGSDGKPLLDSQGSPIQWDRLDEDLWNYGLKEVSRIVKMQCVDPRFDEFASIPDNTPKEVRDGLRLFRPIDQTYLRELRDAGWITTQEAIELDKLCREWKRKVTGNTNEAKK